MTLAMFNPAIPRPEERLNYQSSPSQRLAKR